jgi:hypothetical protein
MEPWFPLPTAPLCRACGQPCTSDTTTSPNRNGNGGRPYYFCRASSHPRHFQCWDDYRGITKGNPRCYCQFTSRRSTNNGNEFFSCPMGRCSFNQNAPTGFGYQVAPMVPATAYLTGTASQQVQGQVVASYNRLDGILSQGVQSQTAVSSYHSTANTRWNAVEPISDEIDAFDVQPHSQWNKGSYVGSSTPPLEQPYYGKKEKRRCCACVVM